MSHKNFVFFSQRLLTIQNLLFSLNSLNYMILQKITSYFPVSNLYELFYFNVDIKFLYIFNNNIKTLISLKIYHFSILLLILLLKDHILIQMENILKLNKFFQFLLLKNIHINLLYLNVYIIINSLFLLLIILMHFIKKETVYLSFSLQIKNLQIFILNF